MEGGVGMGQWNNRGTAMLMGSSKGFKAVCKSQTALSRPHTKQLHSGDTPDPI
jgi:hypothetical protein